MSKNKKHKGGVLDLRGAAFPTEAEGLFTPAEYWALSHYLGANPQYPQAHDELEDVLMEGGWDTLEEAVAAIALRTIQKRLPNWMQKDNNGNWVESRTMRKPPKRKKVLLRPIFVGAREGFGAGPGMGWFCHYYATLVPLFDRFVVTESGDSGDDRVLGSFEASKGFDNDALREIFESDRISDGKWAHGPRFGLHR